MVQIASDMKFDLRGFFFLKAVTYDQNRFDSGSQTYTSDELPGLAGSYSFDSRATLWDGAGGVGSATQLYAYHGDDLSVNGNGFPNAGVITGLVVAEGGLGAYIVGASIDAADISAASQNSNSRDDDLAVLRAALSGDDTARLSRFDDRLYAQAGNDTVYAGAGNDLISGMQGGDKLYGEDGDDKLIGGYGFDRLVGGYGVDTLQGDAGDDRLFGFQDKDYLFGGTGADSLSGGYGFDRLTGDAGADTLNGGAGRDVMDGGLDRDRDVFLFTDTSDSPTHGLRDTVVNFVSGVDKIDLSQIDANADRAGNQAFTYSGEVGADNAVWIETASFGMIVKVDTDGDAVFDMTIRVANIETLVVGDLIL